MQCRYDKGWAGKCKNIVYESGFCEKHKKRKCVVCGEQATHDCNETGQFVCGAPLCDDCTHNIHPEGHNGGVGFNAHKWPEEMKQHCKRSEQKFAPWYVGVENLPEWKKINGIPEYVDIILTNTQ